jgi:DNA-binding response OmpR family regulator
MKKIVVVDDEHMIRRMYCKFLIGKGFEVFEAPNADQANEIVKHEKIDLVLLDIKMPEVKGDIFFEVLRCFHKYCKVIVASVYPLNEQKRLIPDADDYYDKSHGFYILLGKINKVLVSQA